MHGEISSRLSKIPRSGISFQPQSQYEGWGVVAIYAAERSRNLQGWGVLRDEGLVGGSLARDVGSDIQVVLSCNNTQRTPGHGRR